jgi:predicted membrane-bound dolichyl-phosphate-mannose-protein mannosyltransferase
VDLHVSHVLARATILVAYIWVAGCMLIAYGAKRVENTRIGRVLTPALIYIGGFGPLLCAVTLTSYIKELRGAEMKWDKTIKTGKIAT